MVIRPIVVLVACHIGQAKALIPIVALCISRRYRVIVLLDANQPAAKAYADGRLDFPAGCEVHNEDARTGLSRNAESIIKEAKRVLVTLSPVENQLSLEQQVYYFCKNSPHIPIRGYSEVLCGHCAPSWQGLLSGFDRLFVAKQTTDLTRLYNVVEVGMQIPELNRDDALTTKAMLGIPDQRQFIWHCGGPYARAAEILRMLVECCGLLLGRTNAPVDIVFSRHSRDDKNKVSQQHYEVTVQMADEKGIRIIENSADHKSEETTSAQCEDIIPYSRLFKACSENGVIVTGHGADGLKAPYVGIPSILCVGDNLNPHIGREKGCQVLPLPVMCPFQITRTDNMMSTLLYCLTQRDAYREKCMEHYPVHAKTPAEIIVETMLQ